MMGQFDVDVDVSVILSPQALNAWKGDSGYELLVVSGDRANSEPVDLTPLKVGSQAQQTLTAAALALWMDDLPAAHAVFQDDKSADGSLWHAILHRREGDFSNSKYWLARAGDHPVYKTLGRLAAEAIKPLATDPFFSPVFRGGWNPSAFVDLVRQFVDSNDSPSRSAVVTLQRLEWRALFCRCARSDL